MLRQKRFKCCAVLKEVTRGKDGGGLFNIRLTLWRSLLLLISTGLHHLIFSFSDAYIKDDMCGDKNKSLQKAATLVAVFLFDLRRTQTNKMFTKIKNLKKASRNHNWLK